MTLESILHLLRNPYGHPQGTLRQSRLEAAEMLEKLSEQLAAPVASTPITIKELVKSVQAGEKWTVGEPEQLAAPADLVRRLLDDHQRVEPHHADQCELCREATAAIEGQSNSHQIAVKQPAPGERQPSMIASAVYTASGKVFIGSSEE